MFQEIITAPEANVGHFDGECDARGKGYRPPPFALPFQTWSFLLGGSQPVKLSDTALEPLSLHKSKNKTAISHTAGLFSSLAEMQVYDFIYSDHKNEETFTINQTGSPALLCLEEILPASIM